MNGAEFKYDLFFEQSPDLLCIAGYDGYFKKINPAVAKLFGYTMEELYSRPINDFVFAEDKEITARVRTELTRSKPLYNFENRYVTKQGEIVWLSWTSFPMAEDQVIFAIAKNITHKKKLEAERNEMLARLTKVNNDLRNLTYTTSHDLRSPVNNLLALFELMDLSRISDKETLELIEVLHYAGEKLKQTLNNYVDLISEKNQDELDAEVVDIGECLDQVLHSIPSLIRTSGATINTDFSRARMITFNKWYLKSIFLNLVTNSIKYARPDRTPVISIHTEKTGREVRLIVADNGLGFDMDKVKDDIFGLQKRFHHHTDSKGIGLFLVYNQVTSAGGKINVESRPNEGTKFIITLISRQ